MLCVCKTFSLPPALGVVYAPAIPILPKDLRLLYILDGYGG